MSLVTLKEILKDTREKKYAVPAFNFNGYEDAQGMMNSALRVRSPIIPVSYTHLILVRTSGTGRRQFP